MFKRLPILLRYLFYYRRQTAINILNDLSDRYYAYPDGPAGNPEAMLYWIRNVVDVTEKYIGPNSQLREGVKDVQFTYMELARAFSNDNLDEVGKLSHTHSQPEKIINECINHIENNGLYRGTGNNLLGTLSNGELVTMLVTIGIALFGGAFSMGVSYESISHKASASDKISSAIPIQQKADTLRIRVTAPPAVSNITNRK